MQAGDLFGDVQGSDYFKRCGVTRLTYILRSVNTETNISSQMSWVQSMNSATNIRPGLKFSSRSGLFFTKRITPLLALDWNT